MDEKKILAEQFEGNRSHLRAVAYRMLGSLSEADDAVQETWLRWNRSDTDDIENLGGWLTTVTARVCLDMLRSRKARREESLDTPGPERVVSQERGIDPEQEALLADAIGLALLVVLQKLTPVERIAFVLHDMFDLPFDEIAPIVERSPLAARQLASRARRRVQGTPPTDSADLPHYRSVVDAFLAASRGGDFAALLSVLDPNVVFRADAVAAKAGGITELQGAGAVAKTFVGRAQAARAALMDGAVGIVVAPRGQLLLVLEVTIYEGKIVRIEAVADRTHLDQFDVALLPDT